MSERTVTVLLTGATGYLGTLTLARLLTDPAVEVICLVRAQDDAQAEQRLHDTVGKLWAAPDAAIYERLRAVAFDLTDPPREVPGIGDVTHILHGAASVRFDLELEEARAANTATAQVVLDLARRAPRLEHLLHVSTAYVAGTHRGTFTEDDLDVGQGFRNTYEQTKFEAEQLLRREAADLPLTVARPSIVVGEAQTGWTTTFNVLYPLLRAYSRGLITDIPADPHAVVDVVTGDYVADALAHLLRATEPGATHHLVAGPGVTDVATVRDLAAEAFDLPPAAFIESTDGIPGPILSLLGYLNVHASFEDRKARTVLDPVGIEPVSVTAALRSAIVYGLASRWGRRPVARDAAPILSEGSTA
ncbi:unannotated protein [freshwater metagenome]|uniref:Unannotated protein n=1 Tax=freshwater metagenome TaxID=449393 RepID=A0A6J7HM90_9ZZZZ|nr:NAD-dependent epimerase/dehydratase family protein [Actinomycetota bacterium]